MNLFAVYAAWRLERSNENFVRRFNRDARHFNETIKTYCRKPGKVSYVDHEFDQLPPRRFVAADGLHPSFMGVALIAETLKGALCRRDLEVATGGVISTYRSHPGSINTRNKHHQSTTHSRNTTHT
ncbi:hypothetical protein MTO96_015869 [Rhipicephalus appendiculatus]